MRFFECKLSTASAECKHRKVLDGIHDNKDVCESMYFCGGFFSDFAISSCPYRSPAKAERVTDSTQQPQVETVKT